jgi:hypothetical protein
MSDFSEARIGDRVWSSLYGWGEIVAFGDTGSFPITVVFDGGSIECFTLCGNYDTDHKYPSLFWDEIEIIPPSRPKRKVKKVVEGWIFLWPDTCSNVVAAASYVYPTKEEAERVCVKNDALGPPCFIRHEYEVEE